MNIIDVLLISFGVAVDAFAVSVGGSVSDRRGRLVVNGMMAALFFGGFQILMPLAGYGAAAVFGKLVSGHDRWIAFFLLAFVGGRMIWEAQHCEIKCRLKPESSTAGEGAEKELECHCVPSGLSFFHWKRLWVPAIATSIDALAVGGGLFFSGAAITVPALSMGVVTGLLSFTGVLIGRQISCFAGERAMQMIGGAVIILVGVKICFF